MAEFNYCQQQIRQLGYSAIYRVKVTSDSSETKWMNITQDQLNKIGAILVEGDDRNRGFYTITPDDVGKQYITAFGRKWPVADFMGRILLGDVGKRVYQRTDGTAGLPDFLRVENDQQRRDRVGNED